MSGGILNIAAQDDGINANEDKDDLNNKLNKEFEQIKKMLLGK